MRAAHIAVPLAFAATLVSCQTRDGPTAASDPFAPSSPEGRPSFASATVFRTDEPFFYLRDPDRGIGLTVGLVSPIGALPDCGGTGTPVFDGNGTHQEVQTPAGSLQVLDRMRQGTLVLYEGAPENVCDLADASVLARGRGNFTLTIHASATFRLGIQIVGIVELPSGGRALLLSKAQIAIDESGNLVIHVDRTELKPIGP